MAKAERVSFCKKCGKDFAWRLKICPHCGQHEEKEVVPDGIEQCYFSAVAGESFENYDGSSRQKILKRCVAGETIELVHEKGNRYDRWAVQVLRENGEQIGYLPSEQSEEFMQRMQSGCGYIAGLIEVTGGTFDKPHRGAVIYIMEVRHPCDQKAVEAYWALAFAKARTRRR